MGRIAETRENRYPGGEYQINSSLNHYPLKKRRDVQTFVSLVAIYQNRPIENAHHNILKPQSALLQSQPLSIPHLLQK